MQCPHCHKEIGGKACSQCGATLPAESRFCMNCGAELERQAERVVSQEEDSVDLDDRVLCPDGTCTGIIIDGRCTECGKPFQEGDSG